MPVDAAWVCQQESRSVSIAHAGPGPQTASDAYTFADKAPRPVPTASSTSSTQWSRPIRIDVCSMFARMPRYTPAASGIRSAPRIPAAGQTGSSRHVLAFHNSSSRRINEQSSGLLICAVRVRVPGDAHGMIAATSRPRVDSAGSSWRMYSPSKIAVSKLGSASPLGACRIHATSQGAGRSLRDTSEQ